MSDFEQCRLRTLSVGDEIPLRTGVAKKAFANEGLVLRRPLLVILLNIQFSTVKAILEASGKWIEPQIAIPAAGLHWKKPRSTSSTLGMPLNWHVVTVPQLTKRKLTDSRALHEERNSAS